MDAREIQRITAAKLGISSSAVGVLLGENIILLAIARDTTSTEQHDIQESIYDMLIHNGSRVCLVRFL